MTFASSSPLSPATESGLVLAFFVVGRQRNARPKSERNFRFVEPAELRRDERKRLFSRSDFTWKVNLRGCESIVDCCPVGFEVFKNDIVPFNLQLVYLMQSTSAMPSSVIHSRHLRSLRVHLRLLARPT